jgi:hypothetical protein
MLSNLHGHSHTTWVVHYTEAVKSTQQSNADMTIADAMEVSFGDAKGRDNTFKAWQVTVVRDIPFGAIQITLFEVLKIAVAGMDHPYIDGDSFLGEAILVGGGGDDAQA